MLGHDYGAWVSNGDGTHTKTCKNDSKHVVTEDCAGGDPTCEDKPTCSTCNGQYGNSLTHNYGAWVSNGDGTHTKTCKNDATHKVTEDCAGGTATCTEKAVCTGCNTAYGNVLDHTYDQEVATADYKASDATCEAKATYFYSCKCGAKGTKTFENGDALGHAYGAWVANNDGTHTKTCGNDATHKVTENCAGGTATCTEKAVCTGCNMAYGNVLDHIYDQKKVEAGYKASDATCEAKATYYYSCKCGAKGTETFENGDVLGHAYGAWVTNNDGTHTKTCGNDATHKVTENCAGGEATCEEKAVCTGCNTAYGELAAHTWTAATCTEPKTCDVCGATEGEALGHKGGTATCEEKAVCEVCGESYGTTVAHTYTEKNTAAIYKATDADCENAATYHYSCVCGAKGEDTFESGEPLDHDYSAWVSNGDGTHTKICKNNEEHVVTEDCSGGKATCTDAAVCEDCEAAYGEAAGHSWNGGEETTKAGCLTAGVMTFTCGGCGETKTETIEAIGHDYKDVVTDPTCKTKGYTTHTCENCGDSYVDTETDTTDHAWDQDLTCTQGRKCETCGTEEKAPGHNYEQTGSSEADCVNAASKTYTCGTCGDSYTDPTGSALGHNFEGVEAIERLVNGESCKYQQIYVCNVCTEEIAGEFVYHHDYKATVTTEATCVAEGVKTFTCAACGDSYTEVIEENGENGHKWNDGVQEGSVLTYTCLNEGCDATKKTVVPDAEGKVSKDTLADTGEVELENASMALDQKTLGLLKELGDDVKLSADTLSDDELEEAVSGLTEDQKEQIGNNPVYNFTMESGGETVSDFEGGLVTITIPYVLAAGEDVDSIAVWYVDGDQLVSIKATYSNGYITFQVEHFSYYTVTRLTPAERCALYGHNYVEKTVAGDCVTDAYTVYACVRCAYSYKEVTVKADGHNYQYETIAATCSENGKLITTCTDCDYRAESKIVAIGHKWTEESRQEATCAEAGYVEYCCQNDGCEETRKEVLAQKKHEFTHTVVAPTCVDYGYTLHACANCDYEYSDTIKNAIGHKYSCEFVWNDDHSAADAVFTCVNDATHVETITATVTVKEKAATCKEAGAKEYIAKVIRNGIAFTDAYVEKGEKLEHTYSDTLKYNDRAHWYVCTACGAKAEPTSHEYGEEVVTVKETCVKAGETVATCTCGAIRKTVVPATGEHTYEFGVCVECGKEDTACDHMTFTDAVIDMSEYGACAAILPVKVCACGEVVTFDINTFEPACEIKTTKAEQGVDENGNMFMIMEGYCPICGMEVIGKATAVMDGCYMSQEIWYTMTIGDKVIMKDAYGVYAGYSHSSSGYTTIDFKDYSDCGSTISGYVCGSCGELTSIASTNFKCTDSDEVMEEFVDEEGNPHMRQVIDCDKCDLKFVTEAWMVQENACESIMYMVLTVYCGDTVILSYEDEMHQSNHEWKTTYEVVDGDCENGVKVHETCTICGESHTYTSHGHEGREEFKIDLSEISKCGGVISGSACVACGKVTYVYTMNLGCKIEEPDSMEEVTDEDGNVHTVATGTCPTCGLKFVMDMWTVQKSECVTVTYMGTEIYNGEELVFAYVEERQSSNHNWEYNYTLRGETCEDGWNATSKCTICGEEGFYGGSGHNTIYKEVDLSEIGACGGVAEYRECQICKKVTDIEYFEPKCQNIDGSSMKEEEIETENGEMYVMTVTCLDCGLTYKMVESYEMEGGCKFLCTEAVYVYNGEEEVFSLVYEYTEYEHNWEYTYELHGETCEDGWTAYTTCTICGEVSESYGNGHQYEHVKMDLSEIGACGGMTAYQYCEVCKTVTYIDIFEPKCQNIDEESATEEEFETENGWTYIMTVTCLDCGLTYKVVRSEEQRTSCLFVISEAYYVYDGDTEVFSLVYEDENENHSWKYDFVLRGESCDYGWEAIKTCTICGEVEKFSGGGHYWGRERVDLAQYGLCGGQAETYGCLACGMVQEAYVKANCYFMSQGTNEEGYEVGYCEKCGTTQLYRSTTSGKNENCMITYAVEYKFIRDGEEVYAFASSRTSTQHAYTYTYKMNGESCEDGYIEYVECTDCGYSYTNEFSHHNTRGTRYELSEYGACGGYFEIYSCPCGEEAWVSRNIYCDYKYSSSEYVDDNGVLHSVTTYVCETCGLTYVSDGYVVTENCQKIRYATWSITVGETVVFENLSGIESRWEAHDYVRNVVLNGESCEDGYVMTTTCKNCDYYDSYEGKSHNSYMVAEYRFDEYGVCYKDAYLEAYSCPCGYSAWVNTYMGCDYDYNEEYYTDDNGVKHTVETRTCANCAFVWTLDRYSEKNGCKVTNYTTYTVSFGDTVIVDGFKAVSGKYSEHDYQYSFELKGESCEDGYTVTRTCKYCDYVETYENSYHNSYRVDYYDLTAYGACGENAYFEVYSCPCGQWSGTNFNLYCETWESDEVTEYTDDNGITHTVEKRVCKDCGLEYVLDRYAEKVGCYYDQYATYTIQIGGEEVVSGYKARVSRQEQHEFTYSFELKGESCEDGYTVTRTCKYCDHKETWETRGHESYRQEYYDLKTYGACGGYLEYSSCPCGEYAGAGWSFWDCPYSYTSTNYYDDNNNLVYVNAYVCRECGLRFTLEYYSVYDKESCEETTYYTAILNVGAELVANFEYTNVSDRHDYKVTGEFADGATSCNDGVTVVHTCTVCQYSYTNYITYHERFDVETLELKDYGSVCGGEATLRTCLCGRYTDMDCNYLCDMAGEYISPSGVEGALTGNQEAVDGGYYSYNNYAYENVCAVTNPEQCAFGVKIQDYWLNDGCMAYRYQTWLFGYDRETGAYEKEITFKTGECQPYHTFVSESLEQETEEGNAKIYSLTCSLCGSYKKEIEVYDLDGNLIRSTSEYQNNVEDGNRKFDQRIYEYLYYNGYRYTTLDYEEYVNANGEAYWRRYEYRYNFEAGCVRTLVYSDSKGEGYEEDGTCHKGAWRTVKEPNCTETGLEECYCMVCKKVIQTAELDIYHPYSWRTVKAATCSQTGLEEYYCTLCGDVDHSYVITPNHAWTYIPVTGTYYCPKCGLENANGADGDIVMEDLTAAYGNGESYVVGYWYGGEVEFTYYVSLMLHTPTADGNDEIVLTEIEFFDLTDVQAIGFSKSAVAEAATTAGYTADQYDVRFAFVPVGMDGSFDYAITFTEDEAVNTELVPEGEQLVKLALVEGETTTFTFTLTEETYVSFDSYGDANVNLYNSYYCGGGTFADGRLLAAGTYTITIGQGHSQCSCVMFRIAFGL
ncbi:MAG: hypothetical protein IJX81_07195 [Clostridia bacterium]|nr:hypothetical protein [Clostridia bacterium]